MEAGLTEGGSGAMLEAVLDAVREVAEQQIMPRYLNVAHKRKSDGSLYTEADIAAQEALSERLRAIHPVNVVGEEMSAAQQADQWLAGAEGLWCVDPVDGTSNFVNGLPYFAVSVALMRRGRSVLGVVYDPVAREAFYGERDRGAFLNGEPLPIKERTPGMRGCMAGVDFKRLPPALAAALAAEPPYASQRNFGASALDWCYVAAGRLHLYLHGGQRLWDYAAGALILEEAGGHMASLDSDDFWSAGLWQRSVVAALDLNLFREWKQWLRARL